AVFRALVDDNFHYMDAAARAELGTFATYAEAVAACKAIVDAFLTANHRPGMTAGHLYAQYTMFGDDPFVVPDASETPFSAWTYAGLRCAELCADAAEP